jgi:sporulation protein YqfC
VLPVKNRGSWMQRLTEEMELEQEPLPGRSIVEICGDRRVFVENHRGVQSYSQEEICVRTSFGLICIRGCGLKLGKMTRHQLVIQGRIDCVSLKRRGE